MSVAPAVAQAQPVVLMHGTIHVGNGQVIEDGAIAFDKGKITYVGDVNSLPAQSGKQRVIDCTGQHIYPGLIAANSTIGLTEVDEIRATHDYYEVGEYNPDVRSLIAYNTDSKLIPTVRTNGILLDETVPHGGVISGTSSVMMMDGWNWEDAAYRTDIGIHMNWPSAQTGEYKNGQVMIKANDDYSRQVSAIRDFMNNAKAYLSSDAYSQVNIRFESMKGIFDGTRKVFVNVESAEEISAVINMAVDFKLNVVIVGGRESWLVADKLKAHNIPVILNRTHSLPGHTEDDVNLPYKTPKLLHDAGVLYCIGVSSESWQSRNLPFYAGTTAAYGLTTEEALQSVTYNAAKILGIDNTCGTLEVGKDAILFVSKGDALDMMGNQLTYAFIQGRQIELYNNQQKLYDTYMKKYGLTH